MTPFRSTPSPLRTQRTLIRPVLESDVDAMFAYQSLPEVCRYLPYSPRTREQVAEGLSRLARQHDLQHNHDRVVFAVERLTDSTVIGEVHLVLVDADTAGLEVGWVFDPSVAGQGFATEAAAAVVDSGFAAGGHRVVAELDPRNAASIALCLRLGMREEAHFVKNFRDGSEWADTGIYAVLEEEWARRSAG